MGHQAVIAIIMTGDPAIQLLGSVLRDRLIKHITGATQPDQHFIQPSLERSLHGIRAAVRNRHIYCIQRPGHRRGGQRQQYRCQHNP